MEEALSGPRCRLHGPRPVGGALEGVPQVGKEVGLYVDSLLESIGKELSTEEMEDLEKQRCQLEEDVEAEQHPTAPMTKQMTIEILQGLQLLLNQTMDYMENMDSDYEKAGLNRQRVMANLAHYKDLKQKRKKPKQSTLDS